MSSVSIHMSAGWIDLLVFIEMLDAGRWPLFDSTSCLMESSSEKGGVFRKDLWLCFQLHQELNSLNYQVFFVSNPLTLNILFISVK